MYQECRHIKTNGLRCESPALRGTPFCYFHTRLHRPVSPGQTHIWDDVKIPFLQDQASVQIALTEILGALLSSRLDPPRARLCLYGLQIASQNVDCATIFRSIPCVPSPSPPTAKTLRPKDSSANGLRIAPLASSARPAKPTIQMTKKTTINPLNSPAGRPAVTPTCQILLPRLRLKSLHVRNCRLCRSQEGRPCHHRGAKTPRISWLRLGRHSRRQS